MKKKRILAALLSAAMVITAVPVMNVFAAPPGNVKRPTDEASIQIVPPFYAKDESGNFTKTPWPRSKFFTATEFDALLNALANGVETDDGTHYYINPEEVPLELKICGGSDNIYAISASTNKKIKFFYDSSAASVVEEDSNTYSINAKNVVISTDSSALHYLRHSITFGGGLEIDGSNVTFTMSDERYQYVNAKYTVGGDGIKVSNGGSLTMESEKSNVTSAAPEYAFDYATQIELEENAKIEIDGKSSVLIDGAEITGNNPNGPIIDNQGKLTIKQKDNTSASYTKQSAHIANDAAAGADGEDAPPAIQCAEGSEITITGGSTVTSNGDTHADAVDLAPGTTVKTDAGTTVVSDTPVGADELGSYIDNNGNLILPKGGTKTAPDGEPETIPPNSLETPDGTVYTAPEGEEFDPEKIASSIGLYFVKQEGSNRKYDIMLRAVSGDINKFNSAQFTFANAGVNYVITPNTAIGISLIDAGDGAYEFNFNGKDGDVADTAQAIKLGEVEFLGYGSVDFSVNKDTPVLPNQAHATTTNDSLVTDFTVENGLLIVNGDNITVGDDTYLGTITDTEIEPDLVPVQINLMFPNEVNTTNDVDYTAMTVEVNGGVTMGESALVPYSAKIELGSESYDEGITVDKDAKFKYDSVNNKVEEVTEESVTDANANGYKITLEVPVPENTGARYTFKFIGDGYRTYTVDAVIKSESETAHMINVWNNVMDHDITVTESDGFDAVKLPVTFLAGDIVEDNTINLYDLSAVVAYFGKDGDTSGYVQYDLNRDGQIDSKDIAMVLVSWGK